MLKNRHKSLRIEKHYLSDYAVSYTSKITATFDFEALLFEVVLLSLGGRQISNPLQLKLAFGVLQDEPSQKFLKAYDFVLFEYRDCLHLLLLVDALDVYLIFEPLVFGSRINWEDYIDFLLVLN